MMISAPHAGSLFRMSIADHLRINSFQRARLCAGATRGRLLQTNWAIGAKGPAHISIAQIKVEPLWIEVATDPAFVLSVLGMPTIGQTGEELCIAVRAADVFGWSFVVDARVALELGLDEIGIAERQAADQKFVQVVVPPAKRGLDDLVKRTEIERARHDHAPPDIWLDLLESDPHLDRGRDLEHESAVCPATARSRFG